MKFIDMLKAEAGEEAFIICVKVLGEWEGRYGCRPKEDYWQRWGREIPEYLVANHLRLLAAFGQSVLVCTDRGNIEYTWDEIDEEAGPNH